MEFLTKEDLHLHKTNRIFSYSLLLLFILIPIIGIFFEQEIIYLLFKAFIIISLPLYLHYFTNYYVLTAISTACAHMFFSALLIHSTKGIIESHFHIFVFIALMIVYAKEIVILAAAVTIAIHHVTFFFFFPKSVFNYDATLSILVIHALFVVIQTIPCCFIARKFNHYLIEQSSVIDKLSSIVNEINHGFNSLDGANKKIITGVLEQNTALTQTVVGIDQIKEAAHTSNDLMALSKSLSLETLSSAEEGIRSIDKLRDSILKIKDTSHKIIYQIKDNNENIDEISKIIGSIEQKTKLINDIVLQTKLLSFNAPVEAARAGEHGKGFSVVASEINKLAASSGAASLEINEILNTGINRVQQILKDGQEKISGLANNCLERINNGENDLENSALRFKELHHKIKDLNDKVELASIEIVDQFKGISEVTKSIHLLEGVVEVNQKSISQSSESTQSISKLGESLNNIVVKLKVS